MMNPLGSPDHITTFSNEDQVGVGNEDDKPKAARRSRKHYLLDSPEKRKVSKRTEYRWRKHEYDYMQRTWEQKANKSASSDEEENIYDNNIMYESDECTPKSINSCGEFPADEENIGATTTNCQELAHEELMSKSLLSTVSNVGSNLEDDCESTIDEYEIYSSNDEENFDVTTDSKSAENSDNTSNCEDDQSSDDSDHDFDIDTRAIKGDQMMFPAANLTISDVMLMVMTLSIQADLKRETQTRLIDLIKVLAGPAFVSWNASEYLRSKIYNPPRNKMKVHFLCGNLDCTEVILTKVKSHRIKKGEKAFCPKCETVSEITTRSPHQFMSIDVKFQLKLLFRDQVIQENLIKTIHQLERIETDGVIHDIYSGQRWKAIQNQLPGTLTFNFNADGAPLFKSSKQSFWPIQLHINELSPDIRFKHIILAGLFLTSKEPKANFMASYFKVFLEQIECLTNEGIDFTIASTGERLNVKFTCLLAPFDSVARPIAQNRLQFNGYYGCSWCYDHGLYFSKAMRYVLTEISTLREHKLHMRDVNLAETTGKTVRGVKGSFAFQQVAHMDAVWNFPYEYMHALLLGVVKALWKLWTTFGKKGYLNASDLRSINKRQQKIKRPHEIHRLPRSVHDALKWKAAEWKSWLLHDSVPCLEGILDDDCFQSYLLLVRSMNTFLKCEITEREIRQSELDLLQFVGDCEQLYGRAAMTFNLHALLHVAETIRRCGPLWAYSTFPFENGIFHFKQGVHSPNGIAHQIANIYLKRRFIKSIIGSNAKTEACRTFCTSLFSQTILKNHLKTKNDVNLVGVHKTNKKIQELVRSKFDNIEDAVRIFNRFIYKGTVLRSTAYLRTQRQDDTVIQLSNGKIVQIYNFLYFNDECYFHCRELSLKPYEWKKKSLSHLFCVIEYKSTDLIVKPHHFRMKVAHFTTDVTSYVSFLPNFFEIQ